MWTTFDGYRCFLRSFDFRGKTRIESLVRSVLYTPRRSKVARDLVMELDPLEWTQIDLLRDGCIEPRTIALYESILRPGDVYMDVGAHVGFHTLMARSVIGREGRVIAVEPQPYNCH